MRPKIGLFQQAFHNAFPIAGRNSFSGAGTPPGGHASRNGLDRGNGLICRGFGGPTPSRMADVTDGTSNTFAVGEVLPGLNSRTWWWHFNGTTATCGIPLNFYIDYKPSSTGDWGRNYGFNSRHTGGGQFGMTDGSVRFVSENINRDIYHGAATISGGEVLGEF